ncbi:putative vacuolar protein sorting targeting protein pep1 [Rosellinia necatrix]|uniref:Vacuolar protein sorting/targeting protein 10 n=1 Tax=Rosellinia necatrix TaxID=77044 RepID=A0A1W2TQ13_ROSNE|nr:putative vacuolar protein sorting targeting protein pep1 [Rosellinia necatrix]
MRPSGSRGAATSSWWSALLFLAALLSTASTVYAKDGPSIVVKELENPPNNPNYFAGSDVVIFQEAKKPYTIWRSSDGGTKWNKAKGIDHEKSVGLIMHKYDPDRAYVLTLGNVHWKTADKGETWEEFRTDARTSDFTDTFGNWMTFHADDPDKILFTGMECEGFFCEELTMYTTDGFKEKAKLLRRQTQGCWWAKSSLAFTTGVSDLDATRIMCIVRSGMFSPQNENRLYMSDDYFRASDGDDAPNEIEVNLNGDRPAQGVVRLVEVKKYLLAATISPSSAEMALFVTDDTKVWHRAIFPQDHPLIESAYTVLESTNYSIQIDVRENKRTSAPMGTLLTSNSNGTYFTRNIEHTNRNQQTYVDFEKVTGIQGVFLVNQVDNWEAVDKEDATKKIHTFITFDDGRTFEAIKAGDDNIHLHSITEANNVGPIFSSPAPGLVMGNGNRGKSLKDYWESSLYISDDAGKTWAKGPKGPHKYEFGDQGSILLAIQDSKEADVQEIKYSLDHGKKWNTAKLPDNLSVLPWVLTTTQDSTGLKFLLTAQVGSKESANYCIVSIDFEGLHQDKCEKGDMEEWYARKDDDGTPGCIMGHTQKFHRRKKDAKCFIKEAFKEPTPETSLCECTSTDFECDFNFVRNGEECEQKGPVLSPKEACKSDDPEETFMGSSGWRLIPGNDCKRTKGAQKDDKKEWKCSDMKPRPSNNSGEIVVTPNTFGKFDMFEKHYLERSEISTNEGETIIARPENVFDGTGDIFITHDHGKTWATPKELKGKNIYAITTHAYVKDMAFFLTTKQEVYYTTDRGKSIDSFKAPDPLDQQSSVSPLSFHPDRPEWLIWHGKKCIDDNKCYLRASFSPDRGDNWHTLKRYVRQCEFTGSNAYKFRSKSQIICSARARESNDPDSNPLQLLYTDEPLKGEFTVALEHITRFATMAEFIVVATENTTEGTLSALASIDGQTYAHAHFPPNFQVPHQNQFTVLDSSTRAINLFVGTGSEDRPYGSILKSNSNGTSYVLSISSVNAGDGWYVDFEKMLGLEGVALVNTVANQDSDSEPKNLQTRISHNDGAQWSFLPPPQKDVEGKPYSCSSRHGDTICALHLHGYTERVDRRKTYSSESAIGLMFGLGNVGPILGEAEDADTFMTQDAGLSWKEVKKGRWTWSYGDQGSIVVLAQKNTKTKLVSYSLDRGETWQDKEFSESDVIITDITTLRSGSSRNFLLWGQRGKELITFNLDFSGLTDKPCVHDEKDADRSDYELWSPAHPLQPNGCLFGHKNWYLRKKKDRACYNDRQLQQVHNVETCECTRQDYECDYNYELDAHNYCALVDGLRPKDPEQACRDDPEKIEYYELTGLRRIPLTTCKGGTFDPENIFKPYPCPGHEEEFKQKHGVSGVAIFFAVVVPVAFAALVGWWVHSNWQNKFGQIRLGEQSGLNNDSPWIKYPIVVISATVAIIGALPLLASSVWRTVSTTLTRLSGRGDRGRYSWLRPSGPRRFTTRDSFARGRGDYAIVDEDEGELLGDDSDDEA